jgi:hypothetical protein
MPNKTTTVRITSDIDRIKNKFGNLLVYQEAFEIGCDVLERYLIVMSKEDRRDKTLLDRKFYNSLKILN